MNASPRRALCFVSILVVAGAAAACSGSSETVGPDAPDAPAAPDVETPKDPEAPRQPEEPATPEVPKAGPSVVSSSPANGAQSVASDAKIVVAFDRAMDQPSVASAWASDDLPKEAVSFEWNAAGDELTILPAAPLAYAEGGPETPARSYAFRITTAAKDKDGLPLAKEVSVAFTTLRRVTHSLNKINVMTGRILSNGAFTSSALAVGDLVSGDAEREARASLTYMTDDLPDSDIQVEKATLTLNDASSEGAPDFFLGVIQADHVTFSIGSASFDVEPLASRAVTSDFQAKTRTVDVTDMFADDVANRVARSNRSQFRLRYASAPFGNNQSDITIFDKSSAKLEVVYLAK